MKIIYYLLILNICIACNFDYNIIRGNGKITVNEIDVENFNKLTIGGNYDVNLYPSKNPKVVIETDENLHEYIPVEINESGELFISSTEDLNPSESIKIEIYYNELNSIKSMGASKIEHDQLLDTDKLEVEFSGAGAIELNLRVEDLNINLSGAGLISLVGYAENQTVHLSGAGALESQNLESQNCKVFISGIGNAKVKAIKDLDATITGLGNIEYFGTPENIHKNISGLGKIKRGSDYIENKEEK